MTLVTGGTGFIGSHLVDRIVALGMPVRCLVRDRSRLRYLTPGRVELAEGDLLTGAGIRESLEGVETLIHLAGVTKVLHAREYDEGNRIASARLAEICAASQLRRFVHVSSLAAAGPAAECIPLDESAPPRPVSLYGRSKLAGEEAVKASGLGERAVIVRPPVVYGPRDRDVLEVFRLAARGWALGVGRGESWFSLIYIADLVEGLLTVAQAPQASGTYYLANPGPVTWHQFARAAGRALGRRVRSAALPPGIARCAGFLADCASRIRRRPAILSRDKIREGECPYWLCDPARARRELGFATALSMEEGVALTASWYRQAGWLR